MDSRISIINTTTPTFPDRPACWGLDANNVTCTTPTPAMIDFLNVTTVATYFQFYCVNPPEDSCPFGYCPNPDIASPAVRIPTYISTICLSIVILYSNENDITAAFYAQLLSTYSLIVSAIIAIGKNQLTRLHAVFALCLAGSPLMFYLTIYAFKEVLGRPTRVAAAFNTQLKGIKLTLVLILFPLWLAVLIFLALPRGVWQFQQAACDHLLQNHVVLNVFVISAITFIPRTEQIVFLSSLGVLILSWALAIYLQRKAIRQSQDGDRKPVLAAIWHAVHLAYPLIRFCTVILFPFTLWIFVLESGSHLTKEKFQPTYGQLLAIFVAVPPLLQCLPIFCRLWPWFIKLSWVRFLISYFTHIRYSSVRRVEECEMGVVDHQKTGGTPTPLDDTSQQNTQ